MKQINKVKKLITIFLLLVGVLVFSQEFRRSYDRYMYRGVNDTEYSTGKTNSTVVLNYKEEAYIMIYTKDLQVLFKMTSDPIEKQDSKGNKYQEMRVLDVNQEKGSFIIYDDPNLGCLVISGGTYIGFYNNNIGSQ